MRPERYSASARGSAAAARSAAARTLGSRPVARRVEERAVRLLRRMREVPCKAVDEDRGAAVGDRERVAPEPQREPEPEKRRAERVRTLAREIRRHARHADHDRVERRVELCAPQLDRAQQRLRVRDRRRAAERVRHRQLRAQRPQHVAPQSFRQRAVDVAERRARDSLERRGVVRIAAQRTAELRMVQHERDAEQRHALRERALERDREMPALRRASSRAASTRPPRAARRAPLAASSVAGPPCSTDSAALITITRSVSTSARLTRSGGRDDSATTHEVGILDVVDDDVARGIAARAPA